MEDKKRQNEKRPVVRQVSTEFVELPVELPIITCIECRAKSTIILHNESGIVFGGQDLFCPMCGEKAC